MEKRIIYSETFQAKAGMFFAFLLVIAALIIGGYLSSKFSGKWIDFFDCGNRELLLQHLC